MADSTIQPASSSTSPFKAVVRAKKLPATHPKFHDMVIEAITSINQTDRKGASLAAIKSFIAQKYVSVDPNMMKFNVRRALEKGLESGLIVRPKASEESRGVTGRFKLDKVKQAALGKPKEKPKPAKVKETKPKAAAKKKVAAKKPTDVGKSPKTLKTPKKTKSKVSKAEKTEQPKPKPKTQKVKPAGKTPTKAATTSKTTKAKATTKPKTTPKKKAPPKPRTKKGE